MLKTQLDKNVCAKVWDLSNPARASSFDKKMFFMAMHLMYKKKQDQSLELPATVPAELNVSAGEEESQIQQSIPFPPPNPNGGINIDNLDFGVG